MKNIILTQITARHISGESQTLESQSVYQTGICCHLIFYEKNMSNDSEINTRAKAIWVTHEYVCWTLYLVSFYINIRFTLSNACSCQETSHAKEIEKSKSRVLPLEISGIPLYWDEQVWLRTMVMDENNHFILMFL